MQQPQPQFQQTPNQQPIAQQNPGQQLPAQQPVQQAPAQQPVQPNPLQQPVQQVPTQQSVQSTLGQQPVQGMPTQQPVQGTRTQQPQVAQPATESQLTWEQPTTGQFGATTVQQPMGDPAGTVATQQLPQAGQQPTSYAGAFGVGPQAAVPQQQFGGGMATGGQLTSQPTELYPEAFADHLTEEARECLDDCIDVSQVAAWSADRCIEQGPQYAQCARLCNETATLGSVAAEFLAKDAIGLPAVIDAYVETAEQAVEELSKFDTVHTNEAEMVIDRSIDSSIRALETL